MALVGRLAGAILAETEGQFFLVGNPKVPCDFTAVGFDPPGVIMPWSVPSSGCPLAVRFTCRTRT